MGAPWAAPYAGVQFSSLSPGDVALPLRDHLWPDTLEKFLRSMWMLEKKDSEQKDERDKEIWK